MKLVAKSLLVALVVVASSCVKSVAVPRPEAPEVMIPGITRLGLKIFEGNDGDALSGEVAERLVASQRFAVLDRDNLELAVTELGRGEDAIFADHGEELGQLLVASALVVGRVTRSNYKESLDSAKATCVRLKGLKLKEYPCTRHTRTGTISYSAEIRLLKTTTGQLMAVKQIDVSKRAKKEADDGTPGPIDEGALLASCRSEVATQFANAIVPHEVTEKVVLEEDDALPMLSTGNLYAERGDWVKALDYYEKARTLAKDGKLVPETAGKAYYSVALAKAMVFDYDTAIQQLDDAISQYPAEHWIDLQVRVRNWQTQAGVIQSLSQEEADKSATGSN